MTGAKTRKIETERIGTEIGRKEGAGKKRIK